MAVPTMTLSALAATAPRPSGESIAAYEQRILAGINAQLRQLESTWSANWLVLSPVDVTVSNDGGKTFSALTLKDVYTYYPV